MVWQIILLSLGVIGFGLFMSFFYILMNSEDMNKAWIGASIVFVIYLAIVTLAAIPLGAWKALELLGF